MLACTENKHRILHKDDKDSVVYVSFALPVELCEKRRDMLPGYPVFTL